MTGHGTLNEPWNDPLAPQIDDLGVWASMRGHLSIGAQGDDVFVLNRDRLHNAIFSVSGDNFFRSVVRYQTEIGEIPATTQGWRRVRRSVFANS